MLPRWLKEHFTVVMNKIVARQKTGEGITVIVGGAKGADHGGKIWGDDAGHNVIVVKADWKTYGKAAGFVRNQKMLDEEKSDVVLAFPGGNGTADMVRRAKAAAVPVIELWVNRSY
jgi:hypothetical protein